MSVKLETIRAKFGDTSVEYKVAKAAADAAGNKTTVDIADIDSYLKQPSGSAAFLSDESVKALLLAIPKGGIALGSLSGWQQDLARRADNATAKPDGRTTDTEVRAFLRKSSAPVLLRDAHIKAIEEDIEGLLDEPPSPPVHPLLATAHARTASGPTPAPDIALHGKILTMDDNHTVIDGYVVVSGGVIKSVGATPPPAGIKVVETKGIIAPGFMNLHNHTDYNFLPVYDVQPDEQARHMANYPNRDAWPGTAPYHAKVTAPKFLGPMFGLQREMVLYANAAAVMGGTTAIQGGPPEPDAAGLLRAVDQSNPGPGLPAAGANVIGYAVNMKPADVTSEIAKYKKEQARFLHNAEGSENDKHEVDLFNADLSHGFVAQPSYVGIHSASIGPTELQAWKAANPAGIKMVVSALSNHLLYGDNTADVNTAKKLGATIAFGTDWTPSGSKNPLWELKYDYACTQHECRAGAGPWQLSTQELIDGWTKNPAKILGWQDKVGQLKPGMIADIAVFDAQGDDPYQSVLKATEKNVQLVLLGGNPVYGDKATMQAVKPTATLDSIDELGGRQKAIDLPGDESLADVKAKLTALLNRDTTALAAILNGGTTGNAADKFHYRRAVLNSLKTDPKTSAKFGGIDINGDITPEQVDAFITLKYPDFKPMGALAPLSQLADPAYFRAIESNHNEGGAAPVINYQRDVQNAFAN